MFKNSITAYGSVTKFFHWLIAVLVLMMLFMGYFMDDISNKSLHGIAINSHKLLGLTILFLMLLRLAWICFTPKPHVLAGTPRWEIFPIKLVHALFYVTLILMPFSGWVMSVAAGHPPRWGLVSIGLPITKNAPLASSAFQIHSWLAIGIIILISAHVLAALYHHYICHDDTLRRMAP